MKKAVLKKIVAEIISIVLMPCILLAVMLVFDNPEKFVTYSSAKPAVLEKESADSVKQTSASLLKTEYSMSTLPEGEYRVVSRNGQICVLDKNGENVYTVNARLSEFPESDRLVLENGIDAESKSQLEKIVEYLES